MLVDRKVILID